MNSADLWAIHWLDEVRFRRMLFIFCLRNKDGGVTEPRQIIARVNTLIIKLEMEISITRDKHLEEQLIQSTIWKAWFVVREHTSNTARSEKPTPITSPTNLPGPHSSYKSTL